MQENQAEPFLPPFRPPALLSQNPTSFFLQQTYIVTRLLDQTPCTGDLSLPLRRRVTLTSQLLVHMCTPFSHGGISTLLQYYYYSTTISGSFSMLWPQQLLLLAAAVLGHFT